MGREEVSPMIHEDDEESEYQPSEAELSLSYISLMVETLIHQLIWLKVIVEEEIGRIEGGEA
jgi:hypothetical protein